MLNTKIRVIFSALLWLTICQLLFMPIQSSIGQKVADSIQNQLRQELDFSDFQYISRSITDFNKSGSIKCPVLKKIYPSSVEILDLSYMSDSSCDNFNIFLTGAEYVSELKALNGDIYQLTYISANPGLFYVALWSFRLIGLLVVLLIIQLLRLQSQKNEIALNSERELAQAKMNLSQKLAHDIRSPISTLGLISSRITDSEIKELQTAVVKQINEIANKLLLDVKSEKNQFKNLESKMNATKNENLSLFFDNLIKEYKFKSLALKQKIVFGVDEDAKFFKVTTELAKILYPILNNFIQNSIEATDDVGLVKVLAQVQSSKLHICVEDNGKGIPEHVLKVLGNKAITHGKEKSDNLSGNGIAVYNAKKDLEACGAQMLIDSTVGRGTQISIIIS